MDRRKLVAGVLERTGIKLDSDDPAFLLVELNNLMFEDSGAAVAKQISDAAGKFDEVTTRNVDGFVAVANEALSKFIGRTNELKAVLDKIEAAQHVKPVKSTMASSSSGTPNALLYWMIPMAFVIGVLVGFVLPLIVAKTA